ncbi:hypothetical protein BJY01DRAFT_239631 [Aspergillus pseudoustus]|uniref:Cellulose-binding Sde182 nucleoside hydrolase-like domain-containing protein n=1 Tax=Aspergillus pseudoustus TaxID=1810923 RepID=A0ABR4IZ72_9EURO
MKFFSLLTTTLPLTHGYTNRSSMPRTVVITDMEQEDLASIIRHLRYPNGLDTQGIIYGHAVRFYLSDREYTTAQWKWRWTGTRTIQDIVLPAYAHVFPNLLNHDPFFPTPDELLATVKIGNIDFEGEMERDTEGSDFTRGLLLDGDGWTLYLGSIEEEYENSGEWMQTKAAVSRKAVILTSSFQDETYVDYIAPNWPEIRVEDFSAAYETWGYNCERGEGNIRGLPDANEYSSGDWVKANIQTGVYGKVYRSWLDGQAMPGDALDGDNGVFNPLLDTGIQDPANPALGGWSGRPKQNSTSPNLWELVKTERNQIRSEVETYTTNRWAAAVQNDFAARIQWTRTTGLGHVHPRANILVSIYLSSGITYSAVAGMVMYLVKEGVKLSNSSS